jgi:hypothetical protein
MVVGDLPWYLCRSSHLIAASWITPSNLPLYDAPHLSTTIHVWKRSRYPAEFIRIGVPLRSTAERSVVPISRISDEWDVARLDTALPAICVRLALHFEGNRAAYKAKGAGEHAKQPREWREMPCESSKQQWL